MKTAKRLILATVLMSLTVGSTGCLAPRTKVLDPNNDAMRILKAVPYIPPCDGYFVPDAKMLEILDRLTEKDVFGKK